MAGPFRLGRLGASASEHATAGGADSSKSKLGELLVIRSCSPNLRTTQAPKTVPHFFWCLLLALGAEPRN